MAGSLPDFFGRTPDAASAFGQVSLAKVPGADSAIEDSFKRVGALGQQQALDYGALHKAWESNTPAVLKWNNQEVADMENLYNPMGYEAQFAAVRGRRASALSGLREGILGDLSRTLKLSAPGRGASGLGSWMARLAASQSARTRAAEAADMATQERNDLASILTARQAGQGRRQALLDSSYSRMLQPLQWETSGLGDYQTRLNSALQAALANLTSAYGISY